MSWQYDAALNALNAVPSDGKIVLTEEQAILIRTRLDYTDDYDYIFMKNNNQADDLESYLRDIEGYIEVIRQHESVASRREAQIGVLKARLANYEEVQP